MHLSKKPIIVSAGKRQVTAGNQACSNDLLLQMQWHIQISNETLAPGLAHSSGILHPSRRIARDTVSQKHFDFGRGERGSATRRHFS
jgi:hypothetical protein